MTVTSAERRQLVSDLASFKQRVKEVKVRFYDFLVKNDPKGYAMYNLAAYPGGWPVQAHAFMLALDEEDDLYFAFEREDTEYQIYMIIPDAYLDDADAWEEKVLSALAVDREIAKRAVVEVFGEEGAADIKFTTERDSISLNNEYVQVNLDNDTIPGVKWEVFSSLTPLNKAQISVSRKTGKIFEGGTPRAPYGGNPVSGKLMGIVPTV